MAANGPGEIRTIAHNSAAVSISGFFVEAFTSDPTRASFTSAAGYEVRRDYFERPITYECADYSAFSTLDGYMTARTEHEVVVTYIDGGTLTTSNGVVLVRPILNNVSDIADVLIGATSANNTDLDTPSGWTSLGRPLELAQPDLGFSFAEPDGQGLPYFSSVSLSHTLVFPGSVYATVSTYDNAACKLALAWGDGNFTVYDNIFGAARYGSQDGRRPRVIELTVQGVEDAWGDLITYHDGSAGSATPPDYNFKFGVEFMTTGTVESSVHTWA